MNLLTAVAYVVLWLAAAPPQTPHPENKPENKSAATAGENAPPTSAVPLTDPLAGTDAAASPRNENVHLNRIDNNVLRDALVRLGASITLFAEPAAAGNYYAAEFGRAPEECPYLAQRRLAGWHGQLFAFHQNSVFNSRTFFQAGPVEPSRQNFYGFHLGGPLGTAHKLSFEGEQRKIRGMVNGNVLVPRLDERQPVTTDPGARALIERFLRAFPSAAPNRTEFDPRALNTNSPQRIDGDRLLGRWDWALGGSRQLSTQYQHNHQGVDAFQLIAGQNPDTTLRSRQARITLAQPFRGSGAWTAGLAFQRLATVLAPEPNAVGPYVRFGRAIETLGPAGNVPLDRVENAFRAGSQWAWVGGAHRLSAGVELERFQLNGTESQEHRGHFAFSDNFGRSAVENFLLGKPTSYEVAIGDTSRGFRNWAWQAYLGDEWRVSPRWHLNLGLRFGLETAPREVTGRTPLPYGCDCNNFSPRFAFAWQGGGWGVVRGAYAISYGRILSATYQQARFNPPAIVSIAVSDPDLVDPLRGVDLARPGLRSALFLLADHLRAPYSHQYTLSWERQFEQSWTLRLGYVGSRTWQLFSPLVRNRAQDVPGIAPTTETINRRRADPRYYEVTQIVNMGRAYLDAAQASVTLPGRKGLFLTASYTFGKAIDTGADYTSTASGADVIYDAGQSEIGLQEDLKGLSRFDSTHAVLLHFRYDLPARRAGSALRRGLLDGWNLSGAALFKTGTPFTVRLSSDAPGIGNVDGKTSERPHVVDPAVLGRTVDHPDRARQLLPRSAFAYLRPGDLRGSLGRHTFRKDGIDNLNLAVTKHWLLPSQSAERRLLLRLEALNALNHPQFDEPWPSFVNPNFGSITNTLNDGRILQWSLRLVF